MVVTDKNTKTMKANTRPLETCDFGPLDVLETIGKVVEYNGQNNKF